MTRRGLPVTSFLALAGTGFLSLPAWGTPLIVRSWADVVAPTRSVARIPENLSFWRPTAQSDRTTGSRPGSGSTTKPGSGSTSGSKPGPGSTTGAKPVSGSSTGSKPGSGSTTGRSPGLGALVPGPERHSAGYFMLKGGGMLLSEEPLRKGISLGLELGGTIRELLEIGVSVDYFYGGTTRTAPVGTLPGVGGSVRLVETIDESTAHLVPAGVTLRLRVPLPDDRFVPFVSGTVAYEWLFFHNIGQSPNDPLQRVLQEESFTTIGWMGAAGLNLKVSTEFEVFGEAGLHHGSPSQTVLLNGSPVELRVLLDGVYARAGLRLGV